MREVEMELGWKEGGCGCEVMCGGRRWRWGGKR